VKAQNRMLAIAAAAVLAASACSREPKADAAAEPVTSDPNAVVVDAQMAKAITVEPAAVREVSTVLTIAGKVQFDEDRLARVLAPLPGQITGLAVKVGDPVAKGQRLFTIASRDAAAAIGEHIEAQKDLDLAEKTASMTEDLFNHEAASRISLQQAQNDLAKAKARVARSEEALRVLGLTAAADSADPRLDGRVPIVSPIAGSVIERRITDGQFVQSDSTPLVTIGNLSEVWVLGDVFERDLRLVTKGQAAAVTTAAYPGESFDGRVDYISDTIDPDSRTAKLRVRVANPRGELKPEMYASIALRVTDHQSALVVPARAVFTEVGRTFVFVDTGAPSSGRSGETGRRFVRRPVDVAPEQGADRRVTSGVSAGERVVADGALLLREELDKKAE